MRLGSSDRSGDRSPADHQGVERFSEETGIYLAEAEQTKAIGAFEHAYQIQESSYRASIELANIEFKNPHLPDGATVIASNSFPLDVRACVDRKDYGPRSIYTYGRSGPRRVWRR